MGTTSATAGARIGETVAGKYRLNRLIGQGAIGAVYAAVHQFTGRHVALKLIDPRVAAHEGYAARFLREARAAAQIGHPAICDVLDAGQEADGSLYLALELLEGRTLEAAIEANDLRRDEIVKVGIELLEGLAAAHDRGIVHRDIKPDNVFLTWDEQGELHVKLLDFGVAKNTKGGPEVFTTQQGAVLGTPYYMSPEQAAGDPVDVRADIWSAGAVLFHALTGRPPFDEDTYNRLIAKLLNQDPPRVREVRPDVPEWLAAVIDRALLRDVSARWQSARTMAEALRRQGKAPIELDWEAHEDATVRTESLFDPGESPPALAVATSDQPNIEIDIELTGARPAVTDAGATLRTEPPPSASPPPRSGRSGLWLGLLLGVLVTAAVALAVGYFLVHSRIAELPARPTSGQASGS
ncbi:MAG TPA: serine/threonine-protein kinase [Sandaracinaceae bacterium]